MTNSTTSPLLANSAAQQLVDIGVIDPEHCGFYRHGTRDRPELDVWRDRSTDVLFLSSSDHVHERFYEDKTHPELRQLGDRDRVLQAHQEDTRRRVELIAGAVANRDWLDVGTGAGAILDQLAERTTAAAAVEPQGEWRAVLTQQGYQVYPLLQDVPTATFDVITLFHVLEHFTRPLDELREVRRVLRPGGRVTIEVPHARDVLIGVLHSEAFQDHTFWSEHLVLHTRESIRRLVEAAGLMVVSVEGVQRYPVANHLHWLAEGRPGGQNVWAMLRDPDLDRAYAATLARMDATDTLIATATA